MKPIIALVIFLLLPEAVLGKCRLRFNEFSALTVNDPVLDKELPWIELKFEGCEPTESMTLYPYVVMAFDSKPSANPRAAAIFYASLSKVNLRVIGGELREGRKKGKYRKKQTITYNRPIALLGPSNLDLIDFELIHDEKKTDLKMRNPSEFRRMLGQQNFYISEEELALNPIVWIISKAGTDMTDAKKLAVQEAAKRVEDESSGVLPTMRLFKTAYYLVKRNEALTALREASEMITSFGVDVVTKHRSHTAAARIVKFQSDALMEKLFSWIKQPGNPFSFMVDSSTDPSGNSYAIMSAHIVFRGIGQTHYLGMLKLEQSETGSYLFGLIKDFIEKNGLVEAFRDNLLAYVSDSANVVAGDKKGVFGRMRAWVMQMRADHGPSSAYFSTQIIQIKCSAHKLELLLKSSLGAKTTTSKPRTPANKPNQDDDEDEDDEDDDDDDVVNVYGDKDFVLDYASVTSFKKRRAFIAKVIRALNALFNSVSTKRLRQLEAACRAQNVKCVALRNIFDVRWSTSEELAVESVEKMYKPLLTVLWTLAADKTDGNTAAKAASLLYVLTDLQFMVYMSLEADVIAAFAAASRDYQSSTSTMYEINAVREGIVKAVATLLDNGLHEAAGRGKHLDLFLKQIQVQGPVLGAKKTKYADATESAEALKYIMGTSQEAFAFTVSQTTLRIGKETTNKFKTAAEKQLDAMNNDLSNLKSRSAEEIDASVSALRILKLPAELDEIGWDMTDDTRTLMKQLLFKQLQKYFPAKDGATASRLDPKYLLDARAKQEDLFKTARKDAAKLFNVDADHVERSWHSASTKLINARTKEPEMVALLESDRTQNRIHFMWLHSEELKVEISLAKIWRGFSAVPTNTASIERSFSRMTDVRDPKGNRIGLEALDARMRIYLNGPPIDAYDPLPDVLSWRRNGHAMANDPAKVRGKGKKTLEMEKKSEYGDEEEREEYDTKKNLAEFYKPIIEK